MRRRNYGEKVLVDLGYFRDRVSGPVPARLIIVGRRTGALKPRPRRRLRVGVLPALVSPLLIGVGIPQLTEYMWRRDAAGLAGLAAAAVRRTAAMTAVSARCRFAQLSLGTDRAANAAALVRLLEYTATDSPRFAR